MEVVDVEEIEIEQLNYKKIGIIAKQDNLEDTISDYLIIKIIERYKNGTIITNNKKMNDFYKNCENIKKENIFRRYSFLLKNRFIEKSYFLLDDYQITNDQLKNISLNLNDKKLTFITSYPFLLDIYYDIIIITTTVYHEQINQIYDMYLKDSFDELLYFYQFLQESLNDSLCICVDTFSKKLSFIEI